MPGCRALSLVPWGISVPSTCPRPGSRTRALSIVASPREGFPANQDSLDRACLLALSQAAQHTLGEVAISQNTTSSTWQRGSCSFCFSHREVVCVPPPEGALATNSSKQGQIFCYCCSIGQWQQGQCPLPTEWWREGDRLGVHGPPERGRSRMRDCSWTTQSSWKCF